MRLRDWIEDIIGAACLFGSIYIALVILGVLHDALAVGHALQ